MHPESGSVCITSIFKCIDAKCVICALIVCRGQACSCWCPPSCKYWSSSSDVYVDTEEILCSELLLIHYTVENMQLTLYNVCIWSFDEIAYSYMETVPSTDSEMLPHHVTYVKQ